MTQTQQITPTEAKTIARTEQIIEGINQGKTFTEIAENLGISRTALYSTLNKEQAQQLMYREYIEQETTHLKRLEQLWNSPSPTDRRTAIKILEQRQKRIQDKLQPTTQRHEVIKATIDLQKYQTHLNTLEQAINQQPPTTKKQIWQTYQQLQKQQPP